MEPYQEEYIANCKTFRDLTSLSFLNESSFDASFVSAMENMQQATALSARNTRLLQKKLLPVLDDLYQQELPVLRDLECFADALTAGAQPLDLALANQIHEALLSCARREKRREDVIRELYKLGMTQFQVLNMMTSLEGSADMAGYSMRMRYCFVEAASYIKYYDEFSEETKSYILRSVANTYLGTYPDWRDKLSCVRHTMQVFNDERYRASAPGLPWDRYINLIHRQMVSILPTSLPEGTLSPDTVVDVMESAHLIYELQYEEAARTGKPLHAHSLMPYYSVEFVCGLISREELLTQMEMLMDAADPSLYDSNTNYQIISMPAFYTQHLRKAPELIPPRQKYIIYLYRRLLRYLEDMPSEKITEQTRLYVRQLMTVFWEFEDGVTYQELAIAMMTRFAPELYAHGYAVGKMAQAICQTILDEEPGYFDDIPDIAEMDAAEKRKTLEEMSLNAGLLHDIGKLSFTTLYNHAGRQMLQSEETTLRLHTIVGCYWLKEHPSTRPYSDVAFGHHRWYDGNDGYPTEFLRKKSPCRALVDIVAFADYLDSEEDDAALPCRTASFEEKLEAGIKLEGRRFSPLVTGWLRSPGLSEKLKAFFEDGRKEGYYHCFLHTVHTDE